MKTFLAILIVSFCCASCTIVDDDEYGTGLLGSGVVAPDFTISVSDSLCFNLSDLRGSYVLVEFWASWCPDCQEATPAVKRIFDAYSPHGLVMLGISFDEDEKRWSDYIVENGLAWIQHREEKPWKESTVSASYNVRWIPTFYLIAPDGTVDFSTVDVEAVADSLQSRFPGVY